jgi:16S rRNA (cytosine967-C5)-methyltransferase
LKLHRTVVTEIVRALHSIFAEGRYADKAIEYHFKTHPKWGARDRKLFAESVYDIVRDWRWYWHLGGQLDAQHKQPNEVVEPRLWKVWAAYWIVRHDVMPEFTECKDMAPDMVKHRMSRCENEAIRTSVPDWLHELGTKTFGAEWRPMIKALNEPADVCLRANSLKISAVDLQTRLAAEDISAQTIKGLPDGLRLAERRNIFTSPTFKEGLFELQDGASQRVAPFLEVAPGMKVIDGCAGAGGKALHIGSLMKNKGRIIALDVHQRKLDELRRRAARNGVDTIETRLIEDPKALKKYNGSADRLLLDVPCSGLGVLRRNPDAKWKLSLAEIDRLKALQKTILNDYSKMVKPGGKMVYATCSILPDENERQVQAFLQEHGEHWKLEDELVLWPHRDGFDGFYAARLLRL